MNHFPLIPHILLHNTLLLSEKYITETVCLVHYAAGFLNSLQRKHREIKEYFWIMGPKICHGYTFLSVQTGNKGDECYTLQAGLLVVIYTEMQTHSQWLPGYSPVENNEQPKFLPGDLPWFT